MKVNNLGEEEEKTGQVTLGWWQGDDREGSVEVTNKVTGVVAGEDT